MIRQWPERKPASSALLVGAAVTASLLASGGAAVVCYVDIGMARADGEAPSVLVDAGVTLWALASVVLAVMSVALRRRSPGDTWTEGDRWVRGAAMASLCMAASLPIAHLMWLRADRAGIHLSVRELLHQLSGIEEPC